MMNSDWPGICFDHYEGYLGSAAYCYTFRSDEFPLQILRYDGLFNGCSVLCSIGFAQFSSRLDHARHQEVVMAVDRDAESAGSILAMTLLYLGEAISSIPVLASKGGISELDSRFAERYNKDAIYFTEPFPFPDGFAEVRVQGTIGTLFLAVFIDAKEHEFLKENGAGALEEKLEAANADPFCLDRPSVV